MTTTHTIVGRAALTPDEREQVRRLEAICDAHEGLALKLTTELITTRAGATNNAFLYYADGQLCGYCAIDMNGATEAEICGMVDPAFRRQGVGQALLDSARTEGARRGIRRLLLICEEASASGQRFVAATHAPFLFSEHRLMLGTLHAGAPRHVDLTVELAGPDAVEEIARIAALAFGDPVELVRARTALDITDPTQRFYLARLAGMPAASLKVYPSEPATAGIYAFGVLPHYRGQGIGRQMLVEVIKRLQAEGRTRILLEVETTNSIAVALYCSCGFEKVTTYGYYALDL
jgi:ribosomal protein S18 acetylase RimI-like enzyme